MTFPSAFQARLQDLEDSRQQRLDLLQAERELQKAKNATLFSQNAVLHDIRKRCMHLNHEIAQLDLNILLKENEVRAQRSLVEGLQLKEKGLNEDVHELTQLKEKKSSFYAEKRAEMESFLKMMDDYISVRLFEFHEMQQNLCKLESELAVAKNSQTDVVKLENEIEFLEKEVESLMLEKETLQKEANTNLSTKNTLEKRIQMAIDFQREEKRRLYFQQKQLEDEIEVLQKENLSLENKVLNNLMRKQN